MSLATYGVLKCRALERQIDPATDPSPHYQVLVSDGQKKHRKVVLPFLFIPLLRRQ